MRNLFRQGVLRGEPRRSGERVTGSSEETINDSGTPPLLPPVFDEPKLLAFGLRALLAAPLLVVRFGLSGADPRWGDVRLAETRVSERGARRRSIWRRRSSKWRE